MLLNKLLKSYFPARNQKWTTLISSSMRVWYLESYHKHLGLSFEKHLCGKMKKAKKRYVGIIKNLNKYLPLKTLDQMYKRLI